VDSAEDNARFRRGAAREARQPIRFAGLVHGAQRHVCAFFHNPDEGVSARLSFIKERFERGQTAFQIVDPKFRAEHQQRLALSPHQCGRSGTESATSRGTLELMRIYKGESCA